MCVEDDDLFEVEDKASFIYTPDDPEYREEEPDFEFTEEQAIEILEECVSDVVDKLSGERTTGVGTFQRFNDALKRAEYVKKARLKDRDAARNLRKQIQRTSRALTSFLRAFFRAYLKYRPTPSDKIQFPYSQGRYQNSSIIYFTNDVDSRNRAIQKAVSNKFDYTHPFFGQDYVLNYLEPSRIMRADTSIESVKARVEKIKGGISIENIAFKYGPGYTWYYGWNNVEINGWKRKNGTIKPPYAPFYHALVEAESECPNIVSYSVVF